jgi:hypothetical protein
MDAAEILTRFLGRAELLRKTRDGVIQTDLRRRSLPLHVVVRTAWSGIFATS